MLSKIPFLLKADKGYLKRVEFLFSESSLNHSKCYTFKSNLNWKLNSNHIQIHRLNHIQLPAVLCCVYLSESRALS